MGKHRVKTLLQPFATIIIDSAEVGTLHACKPHEIDIPLEKFLDAPGGVDIAQICEDQHLEHHLRIKGTVASAPVGREDIADVKTVYDRIDNPHHVVFGHEFIQQWWKKQFLFSIVGFLLLTLPCYAMIISDLVATQIYKIFMT